MINAGQILIAPPAMPDLRFKRTVIFMAETSAMGSWGLVVNRELGQTARELFEDTEIDCNLEWPVYWGGPVNPGVIWLLHDRGWSMSTTLPIGSDWAITSHPEMFDVLSKGYCPRYSRIIAGTACWGPGQLESELDGHPPWNRDSSWLYSGVPSVDWLLEQDVDLLWSTSVTESGHQAVDSWIA